MKREIKAPSVGESITEVRIGSWKKPSGSSVKAGEVILEIESDKATVEVIAEFSGALTTVHNAGDTVNIGTVLGYVEEGATGTVSAAAPAATVQAAAPVAAAVSAPTGAMAPSVRRISAETGIDPSGVTGTGHSGRVTKEDMINHMDRGGAAVAKAAPVAAPAGPQYQASSENAGRERRVPMTTIRKRIAERLVQAQHNAAILSTFNECDMFEVMKLRAEHKDSFKAKHGVGLSFMSFFTRAAVEALKAVPAVNAMIDGTDIIYREYFDIGVAVGTEKGLVVPVLRDAGKMSFVDIEKGIGALALKARDGKLSIKDMSGGTFTISNGGTYGSLLSTPILNPPQSGILGMHKIQERPIALNGQVAIRPMMYLALSYDHRMIDGKEAVTFLIKLKEGIENPKSLGFEG